METHALFATIACVIMVCGDIPYMVQTYRGKVKPNITTWGLWMIICLAVVLNYKSTGAEENAWPAITDTVTVSIITILAIWRRGDLTRLTTLEWASIILCLSSLAGWWITKDDPALARWSFALAMLADVAACAPVIRASWTTPEDDRPYTWILYGVANTIGMGAISDHTVANYTLPVYLIGLSVLVATPLIRYRIKNAIPIKEWI